MEFITFGPVHLNVTDLKSSVYFYHEILGMQLRDSATPAELGTSERTLVVLHKDAKIPYQKGYSGLYHFAIHIPTEKELAQLFVRLAIKSWRTGPTDHIGAKSIYVKDPDGIDIELSVEIPNRVVEYKLTRDEFKVIDDKGRVRSPIEPLDVQELLSHLSENGNHYLFPEIAIVGHMNLHMPNLRQAYDFYKKMGFEEHFLFPNMGWGDLGAGGRGDPRMVVNTWAGVNAPLPPLGMAGLRMFVLKYDSDERLNRALRNISTKAFRHDGYLVQDPGGNRMLLTL